MPRTAAEAVTVNHAINGFPGSASSAQFARHSRARRVVSAVSAVLVETFDIGTGDERLPTGRRADYDLDGGSAS